MTISRYYKGMAKSRRHRLQKRHLLRLRKRRKFQVKLTREEKWICYYIYFRDQLKVDMEAIQRERKKEKLLRNESERQRRLQGLEQQRKYYDEQRALQLRRKQGDNRVPAQKVPGQGYLGRRVSSRSGPPGLQRDGD